VSVLENVCKCVPTISMVIPGTGDNDSMSSSNSGQSHHRKQTGTPEAMVTLMHQTASGPRRGSISPTKPNGSPSKPDSSPSKVRTSKQRVKEVEERVYPLSIVHLTAARCRVQLFNITCLHSPHLELAYKHYQNAIETLAYDLSTMFKLPVIFFELGRMLEVFGAFDLAIEMYGKILAGFPNYRGKGWLLAQTKTSLNILFNNIFIQATLMRCIERRSLVSTLSTSTRQQPTRSPCTPNVSIFTSSCWRPCQLPLASFTSCCSTLVFWSRILCPTFVFARILCFQFFSTIVNKITWLTPRHSLWQR
jgi:hypothetical protein